MFSTHYDAMQCITAILSLLLAVCGHCHPITDQLPQLDKSTDPYDRSTLRTLSLIYSKAVDGRMILLLCRRACYAQRAKIPRWLREFNEKRNISASDAQIGYHFHIMRREFDFLGVSSLPSERFPHIVYVIGGRSFHFNASISSKADFMEFLEEHEEFPSDQIDDEHQLEQFINNAQSCQPVKQLLLIYDPERCPIPHFDNVVRGLRFTTNYSFSELLYPLDGETKVELLRRLDELPSICQLLVIMQNNGYVWTSADKNSQEMRSTIETLENKDCTMLAPGWLPIGRALTDIEKVFMREEDLSSDLQWSPGCIMVGATGGIAVVALAISIFWGLNGSSFVTK